MSQPASLQRAARRRARGFTLAELLVSLTAGLIIAVAVVGLARVTTRTLHEESRVQATELSVRIAAERLRADLARAGFMATPNLRTDPMVARAGDGISPYVAPGLENTPLETLAAVRILDNRADPSGFHGPVADPTVLTLSQSNTGINPDGLVLTGNFTTADEYIVQSAVRGGQGCGGDTLTLSLDSPAIARLLRDKAGVPLPDASALQALQDAFTPYAGVGSTPANPTSFDYLVRVTDDAGKYQFLRLCQQTPLALAGGVPQLFVRDPVMRGENTASNGGTTGFGVGRLTVNPVQMVRWSLRDSTTLNLPAFAQDRSGSAAATNQRLDLVREMLDATGRVIGAPELIAEYVVDFEISFTYENSMTGLLVSVPFGQQNAHAGYLGAVRAGDANLGPQWIRSLRYRVAARTAIADRNDDLPAAGGDGSGLYRYKLTDGAVTRYARMRTLTGEVALPNQTKTLR